MPGRPWGRADPDDRWLTAVMHAAFFLLLGSSLVRFLTRDQGPGPGPGPGQGQGGSGTAWVVALFAVFGLVYVLGRLLAPAPRPGARPTARHLVWLGTVSAVWIVLLALAPSATWCAMPLLFSGLHTLPARIAVPVVAGLTALVVASQLRGSDGSLNPNMVFAPCGHRRGGHRRPRPSTAPGGPTARPDRRPGPHPS